MRDYVSVSIFAASWLFEIGESTEPIPSSGCGEDPIGMFFLPCQRLYALPLKHILRFFSSNLHI